MTASPIPAGYRAVPLEAESGLFAWRMAILVRAKGPADFELVTLANLPDARAYLGCVLDQLGMAREWLQIWVQDVDGLFAADSGMAEQLTNDQLDRRWQRQWRTAREMNPNNVVLDVAEGKSRPLFLDVQQSKIVQPVAPDGAEWTLCRDDRELQNAGLPLYTKSIWRYLWTPGASGGAARFVATDSHAPMAKTVSQKSPELGFQPGYLAINPQGGQMEVRIHSPLNFENYLDLLGGAKISDIASRNRECEAAMLSSRLGALGQDGRRHGFLLGDGNAAELFYLKLRLFVQAARILHYQLRDHQCPLLNLDPASFGINFAGEGELPWPWTTTCELVRPGRALPFAIPGTKQVRFVAVGDSGAPAYCPAGVSRRSDMGVTIRPMRIAGDDRQISIEGYIWVSSPVPVETSDIVRFRLSQPNVSGDFFAAVVVEKAGLVQEIKFQTWPREMSAADIAQLKRFEGGKLERCWCEFIPALSSPYDLYSLSVLGARAMLTNRDNSLGTVMYELERFGRAVGNELAAGATWEQIVPVVGRLLAAGNNEALTARQIFGELPNRPKNSDFLPPQLWAETIAILLRLMPGLGPVSACTDYGAAPAGGLHAPLQQPLEVLEGLCGRARGLIFSDWNANRELRAVLAKMKEGL